MPSNEDMEFHAAMRQIAQEVWETQRLPFGIALFILGGMIIGFALAHCCS